MKKERYYRVECVIRDEGEPCEEERKNDSRSVITADISLNGRKAPECLINIVKGMMGEGLFDIDSIRIERDILEDVDREKTTNGEELVCEVEKEDYKIKVYRMG